MKTPIELIKHKKLNQKSMYAYYLSLPENERNNITKHYASLSTPSAMERKVIKALTYSESDIISQGDKVLRPEIVENIKSSIGVDLDSVKVISKSDTDEYFQKELHTILDNSKMVDFVDLLPIDVDPKVILLCNFITVFYRNVEVVKLRDTIKRIKDKTPSEQERKFAEAVELIQNTIKSEGTCATPSIPSFDEVIVNDEPIIAKDIRINYEKGVAEGITNILHALNYPIVPEACIAYAHLWWFEMKQNDAIPIDLESIGVELDDTILYLAEVYKRKNT